MAKSSSRMQNNVVLHQNDKIFARLLSKEKYNTSKQQGDASFRVLYYGGAAGSVPFTWESQPGTPKHRFNDNPLPPLTPPPSYKFNPKNNSVQKNNSKNSKFINSIFQRNPSKKINSLPSFSPSSSYSSSYSLPSSPLNKKGYKTRSSSARLDFDEYEEDQPRTRSNSPNSTLCFGPSSSRRSKGYSYPIKSTVKKVVLSMVGHGTRDKLIIKW